MEILIRKAQKKDLKPIRDLVIELAIYEKEPKAVTASLADYEEAFEEGIFEVLLAVHNQHIIGIALYYMTYSTWKGKVIYLEDFIVQEKFRRFGTGQLLFDELQKEAFKKEAILIKWQVLDWNAPAIKFYQKNDASFEDNWLTCKFHLKNGC